MEEKVPKCPAELRDIFHKVLDMKRISFSEGKRLSLSPHIHILQYLANTIRLRKSKNIVTYGVSLHLYPTNECSLACPLCSFYAKKKEDVWFFTPEQLEKKVLDAVGTLEKVHIVGGIDTKCSLKYYTNLFCRIKNISSKIHIKALTPPEIDFLANQEGLSIEETLLILKKSGLDSIPGGGAEILVDKIRAVISPKKISSNKFLEIHKSAHKLNIPSNITMLYGHIEEYDDILLHLDAVRKLQDETGMIQAFIPLVFQPQNTLLLKENYQLKEKCHKRIFALARIMLDNIPHIKVLWNYTGLELAKELLHWGGNDLGGVVQGEKVSQATKKEFITETVMQKLILEMGRLPVKTNHF